MIVVSCQFTLSIENPPELGQKRTTVLLKVDALFPSQSWTSTAMKSVGLPALAKRGCVVILTCEGTGKN